MIKRVFAIATLLCFSGAFAEEGSRNLSAAPSTPSTKADMSHAVARARVQEMESLTQLTAEGESLYQSDPNKKGPYDYKGGAARLIYAGEFRQAIRELTKMLFLGTKTRDDNVLAYAKMYLAMAYSYSGSLERAKEYAEQSLGHYAHPRNRNDIRGWDNKILGDVASRRGDANGAIVKYEEAVDYAEDNLRFYARASLASAYANAGQMDKAKKMVTTAESYIEVVNARSKSRAEATFFRLKADIAMRESRFSDAVKMFEDALSATEKSSGSDAPYEKFRAFEGIGRAKIALGDKAGTLKAYLSAVTVSEQVRAMFRSEEVTSGLFGQMQYVFNEAVALLMESGEVEAAWDISERGRARALLDMVRNRVSLSADSNVFVDSLAKSVKSSDVASLLTGSDVIVEYHVTDKKTYAWVIRRSGMSGMSLDLGQRQLAKQVEEFRDALSGGMPGSNNFGKQLHDALVKPLGLKSGEKLIIIPHDALHYLPFQALQSENTYLIETFPISYAPSASTFVAVMQRELAKKGPLFALANPDLNDPKLALPGAQIEVEHIKALFPGSEAYFQADATKERLFQGVGKAKLIHIAAHALADPVDPLYSHIYLAASNGKPGMLEAREVYGLDLKGTALVALSACQSGLGKVSQGDEIWGFTRSFLSAGSSSVLVSLWSVSDDATEMLMTKFYQGMGKVDARQSLRAAQITVLKDPRFSHPFYWAPFNLVGDWR